MRHLASILLLSANACWASDQQQDTVERFKLRAKVQDVTLLRQFAGTVVETHFDPRYALTLRVESMTPPLATYTNGAIVTFAIHSPSRLFAGEVPKGKTVDFMLSRQEKAGSAAAWMLEVERTAQPFQSETNRASGATGSNR
jgi:hypothetical protein